MRERTSLVARLGKLPTRPLSPVGVADECFEEPRRQPAGMPENTSRPFSTAKGCFKKNSWNA